MEPLNPAVFGDLFNSSLEAGIRAVVLLESLRPETADLSEMVLLDHVVVHTSDIGGPDSLHAEVPGRKGELLIRRSLVAAGLKLMQLCHLVEEDSAPDGLIWRASDSAASYVELLESDYSVRLKDRAAWLADEVRSRTKDGFTSFAREQLGDWSDAFGSYGGGTGARV